MTNSLLIGLLRPLAIALLASAPLLAAPAKEIIRFPVDDLTDVITRTQTEFDQTVSSDGKGSLRISANTPMTVQLYEVEDLNVHKAQLIYQARVRTENLDGQAYLEMWCHFTGKGQYFSRALQQPFSGTTEWTTTQTPFFLQKGQKPDRVSLNLVVNGTGTVWVDDIRLLKAPLK